MGPLLVAPGFKPAKVERKVSLDRQQGLEIRGLRGKNRGRALELLRPREPPLGEARIEAFGVHDGGPCVGTMEGCLQEGFASPCGMDQVLDTLELLVPANDVAIDQVRTQLGVARTAGSGKWCRIEAQLRLKTLRPAPTSVGEHMWSLSDVGTEALFKMLANLAVARCGGG